MRGYKPKINKILREHKFSFIKSSKESKDYPETQLESFKSEFEKELLAVKTTQARDKDSGKNKEHEVEKTLIFEQLFKNTTTRMEIGKEAKTEPDPTMVDFEKQFRNLQINEKDKANGTPQKLSQNQNQKLLEKNLLEFTKSEIDKLRVEINKTLPPMIDLHQYLKKVDYHSQLAESMIITSKAVDDKTKPIISLKIQSHFLFLRRILRRIPNNGNFFTKIEFFWHKSYFCEYQTCSMMTLKL